MKSTVGFRNFLTVVYILVGTICLFGAKMQNIEWVTEGGIHKHFFHPFMQTVSMFVGETLCLAAYFIMKHRNRAKYEAEERKALLEGRPPAPKQLILIPAVCDFVASCLQYMSLNFIPASIYQMLKGGTIITTFIFSYLLMRKKVKRSELSGCVLSFIGITLVGLSAILFTHNSTAFSPQNIIIGCVLMGASLVINGFQFAYEEKIFTKYHISPMLMVGMQGIFGLVVSWSATVGAMYIPCNFGVDACVFDSHGRSFFQRPEEFWREIMSNSMLLGMTILTILSISFFNLIGLTIIKYINALARALLNLTKTALVWVLGIIVTVTAGKNNSDYEWELLGWRIILTEGIGFYFLILATLIYNQNIYINGLSTPKDQIEEKKTLLYDSSKETVDPI